MKGLFVGGPEHGKVHDIDPREHVWRVPVRSDLGLVDIAGQGPTQVTMTGTHTYFRDHVKLLSGMYVVWLSADLPRFSRAASDAFLDAALNDQAKGARL